jgi:hypothetical protein
VSRRAPVAAGSACRQGLWLFKLGQLRLVPCKQSSGCNGLQGVLCWPVELADCTCFGRAHCNLYLRRPKVQSIAAADPEQMREWQHMHVAMVTAAFSGISLSGVAHTSWAVMYALHKRARRWLPHTGLPSRERERERDYVQVVMFRQVVTRSAPAWNELLLAYERLSTPRKDC